VRIDTVLEKSFGKWRRNLGCSVPFLIEALAILGFVNILSFMGFNQVIDQETIEIAIKSSPFILSTFLMLIIFASYLEAAGLGSVHESLRKKTNVWGQGIKHWFGMFQITIISIILYVLASIPALFILNFAPFSMLGIYYIIFVLVLLSLFLFFSKYVLIASSRGPLYSIKKSAKMMVKNPGFVLKIVGVIIVVNLPILLISLVYPLVGTVLLGFFTQSWSAYFIFMAYEMV
jgi:hypothetical protein